MGTSWHDHSVLHIYPREVPWKVCPLPPSRLAPRCQKCHRLLWHQEIEILPLQSWCNLMVVIPKNPSTCPFWEEFMWLGDGILQIELGHLWGMVVLHFYSFESIDLDEVFWREVLQGWIAGRTSFLRAVISSDFHLSQRSNGPTWCKGYSPQPGKQRENSTTNEELEPTYEVATYMPLIISKRNHQDCQHDHSLGL